MKGQPIRVLLVEDNPGDARLVAEAVLRSGLPILLHGARSGEEALKVLGSTDEGGMRVLPDLIFLDLHLPGMSGFELVHEMRAREELAQIPVVAVTGSQIEAEDLAAQGLRFESVLRKPITPVNVKEVCSRHDLPRPLEYPTPA